MRAAGPDVARPPRPGPGSTSSTARAQDLPFTADPSPSGRAAAERPDPVAHAPSERRRRHGGGRAAAERPGEVALEESERSRRGSGDDGGLEVGLPGGV